MTCKHENLIIMTTELVGQRYWNNPENDPELDTKWGKTLWQTIKSIDRIECSDCKEDVTEEMKDKIDW